MKTVPEMVTAVRHTALLWRSGQLRFRLETFGLYYPALPYSRPFWRAPRRNIALLLRQTRDYSTWLNQMHAIRRSGPDGWWGRSHVSPEWLEIDRMSAYSTGSNR